MTLSLNISRSGPAGHRGCWWAPSIGQGVTIFRWPVSALGAFVVPNATPAPATLPKTERLVGVGAGEWGLVLGGVTKHLNHIDHITVLRNTNTGG